MAKNPQQTRNLNAGEFYGTVTTKKIVASSVISEIVHSEGKKLPKHSHELAFFSLLIDGSYAETYSQKSFVYRPMTIWWHPADVYHQDEIGQTGGRFFSVEIQQKGLENLKEYTTIPEDFFEKSTSLVWLAFRLYHEFKNWQKGSELIAEGLTLEMLGHSAKKELKKEKHSPKWLDLIIDKLHGQFTEKLSAEELALEADVHPIHLAAVFRKFQNQTIGEYVQNLRIQHAADLLIKRETPLSEIAVSTGFSDQSHFTRVFKRITGTTPGAFRKNLN